LSDDQWLIRAKRSLKTAHLALADDDTLSAANQAYYAMFYAARGALLFAGETRLAASKTHSGLISAFSEHLFKTGHLPTQLGRSLSVEAYRRQVSDYDGGDVSMGDAQATIANALLFVEAVQEWIALRSQTPQE
jgi:uncharacterized protein (UPF0332 family)